MRLLILGGTVFLGRALVEAALARGHELTLFNRGQHGPELYPNVERIRGDREGELGALRGRRWDAAIDTSGYVPRVVRASAELLADAIEHYTFISTISVYANFQRPGMDERAPVGVLSDPAVEAVDGETYGPLKALCEQAVEQALPERALIVRPGLIVGRHDPSDRFTYWVDRVAQGGELLAPGRPGRRTQLIDVRDLAEWTLALVEGKQTGVYNATGPAGPLSFGDVLDTCRAASGSEARYTWVAEEFLAEHAVGPWIELPLWVPESDPDMAGFAAVDCSKAIGAGLRFRELTATVRDTLAWSATRPADHQWRAGLTRAREAELLAQWHARDMSEAGS